MPQTVRDFTLTPGLLHLARLSSLFILCSNRLWMCCCPIYSHHSTGQSHPLIYWTRLHVVLQRLKVTLNGLTHNAQLTPKSSNLLSAKPGTALLSLELPRSLVKKRNCMKSPGCQVASTKGRHCVTSPGSCSYQVKDPLTDSDHPSKCPNSLLILQAEVEPPEV